MSDAVVRTSIPEEVMHGKRLGRHIVHDPRSRDYPADGAPAIISVTHTAVGLPLNQGDIGSCTANALCGALDSAPGFKGGAPRNEHDASTRYGHETKTEAQPEQPNGRSGTGPGEGGDMRDVAEGRERDGLLFGGSELGL